MIGHKKGICLKISWCRYTICKYWAWKKIQ